MEDEYLIMPFEALTLEHELTEAGLHNGNRVYFLQHVSKYPFIAQSPISVRPEWVKGKHLSVRLRVGWRVWGFETERERDTFIAQFGGRTFP